MSRIIRSPRLVLGLALLLLTVFGASLVTTSSTAASAGVHGKHHAHAPSSGGRPTIVLVHGAWADSSGWNAEIAALQSKGYPVIAVANPLRGLTSDSAYVHSVLASISGPIVLVGHSYGGAVISAAATGIANVEALVYVAAFVPEQGEPVGLLTQLNPGSLVDQNALIPRPYPLPGGGTGTDLYLRADLFHTAFAGDLPLRTARLMAATQRPLAEAAFSEPAGAVAWHTVPSWYLLATKDRTIPPATQAYMAQRAHATVTRVASSHVAMMSHPEATTKLILRAARAVH